MADDKKSDTDSSWCIIPKPPFENVKEQMSMHDAIDMACSTKRKNMLSVESEIQPFNRTEQSMDRKMLSTDKMEQSLNEERWNSTIHSTERKGESMSEEERYRMHAQLFQEMMDTDVHKGQNSCPNDDQNCQLPVVNDQEAIRTLSDVGSEGSSDGFDFIDECEAIKAVAAEEDFGIMPQRAARESIVNTILQQVSLDTLQQESVSNNIPQQESIDNNNTQHKSVRNHTPKQKLDDDARPLKSACFQLRAAVCNVREKLSVDGAAQKKSDNIPCESVNDSGKLEPLNSAVQRGPVTVLPVNRRLYRQRLPVDNILPCQAVGDSTLLQELVDRREDTVNSNVQQNPVSETELEKLKIANKKVIAEVLACMQKLRSSDRKGIKHQPLCRKLTGLRAEMIDLMRCYLVLMTTFTLISAGLLLHFVIFKHHMCAKPAPNLESSLDLIQSSIVGCLGEQYLMSIKSGHNKLSNSALCVHNTEKYVAIIDEYLDDQVLQFLEDGIKNPEDPVFRSFADNHTAIDFQLITQQLQYFGLLPDMKGNVTAVEGDEAAVHSTGNDAMKGIQAIHEFLVFANFLHIHRVASTPNGSGPDGKVRAVDALIEEIEFLNKNSAIYMQDIQMYSQGVKGVVDRLNLTIRPVLLKNIEMHPKDASNTLVLNLLDEVLTMHDLFSDEYLDIKQRTVRLEQVVNRVSELNGKEALLFFLNSISNATSKAFQTMHNSFLCFSNYGDAQKTSECLAENIESMLQITYVVLLNLSEFLERILWKTLLLKFCMVTYIISTVIKKWCL